MISVIICRPAESGSWAIDTWLMSCRVLGRKVEEMVLRGDHFAGPCGWCRYPDRDLQPNRENDLVREHYQKLGFTKTEDRADGSTVWTMSTATEIAGVPMRVRRSGTSLQQA